MTTREQTIISAIYDVYLQNYADYFGFGTLREIVAYINACYAHIENLAELYENVKKDSAELFNE